MNTTAFDSEKLKDIEGLDSDGALRTFGSRQAYYNELVRFLKESENYLQSYTPAVVIFDEDTRKEFLADTQKIRNTLISLGMIRSAVFLSDLDEALKHGNADELSDALQVFSSEMSIMTRRIFAAVAK